MLENKWRSKKYREAAKGQPCTMRLPCCNHNPETTVLAHENGAGMALKHSDHNAADMCFECHKAYDGVWPYPKIDKAEKFKRARLQTILNRLVRGILKC